MTPELIADAEYRAIFQGDEPCRCGNCNWCDYWRDLYWRAIDHTRELEKRT